MDFALIACPNVGNKVADYDDDNGDCVDPRADRAFKLGVFAGGFVHTEHAFFRHEYTVFGFGHVCPGFGIGATLPVRNTAQAEHGAADIAMFPDQAS